MHVNWTSPTCNNFSCEYLAVALLLACTGNLHITVGHILATRNGTAVCDWFDYVLGIFQQCYTFQPSTQKQWLLLVLNCSLLSGPGASPLTAVPGTVCDEQCYSVHCCVQAAQKEKCREIQVFIKITKDFVCLHDMNTQIYMP